MLGLEQPEAYTFHSFRRTAATATAEAGASAQQMRDYFGWKNPNMANEYISTTKRSVKQMAERMLPTGSGSSDRSDHPTHSREELKLCLPSSNGLINQDTQV